MTPTEASVGADLMWLEEPATGVRQALLALAPTDANVGVTRDFVGGIESLTLKGRALLWA